MTFKCMKFVLEIVFYLLWSYWHAHQIEKTLQGQVVSPYRRAYGNTITICCTHIQHTGNTLLNQCLLTWKMHLVPLSLIHNSIYTMGLKKTNPTVVAKVYNQTKMVLRKLWSFVISASWQTCFHNFTSGAVKCCVIWCVMVDANKVLGAFD